MKTKIKILLILISSILLLHIYKYIYIKYHIGIPCIFHEITHLYCPGCGITRAIFLLLELDIKSALKENLLIIFLPLIIIYIINYLKNKINNINKDPAKIFPKPIWYILLIITITYGIIRNFFSILQPT